MYSSYTRSKIKSIAAAAAATLTRPLHTPLYVSSLTTAADEINETNEINEINEIKTCFKTIKPEEKSRAVDSEPSLVQPPFIRAITYESNGE